MTPHAGCVLAGGCVCRDRHVAGGLEDLVNSQAIMQLLVISRGFSERFLLITEIACDYIDKREDSFGRCPRHVMWNQGGKSSPFYPSASPVYDGLTFFVLPGMSMR